MVSERQILQAYKAVKKWTLNRRLLDELEDVLYDRAFLKRITIAITETEDLERVMRGVSYSDDFLAPSVGDQIKFASYGAMMSIAQLNKELRKQQQKLYRLQLDAKGYPKIERLIKNNLIGHKHALLALGKFSKDLRPLDVPHSKPIRANDVGELARSLRVIQGQLKNLVVYYEADGDLVRKLQRKAR